MAKKIDKAPSPLAALSQQLGTALGVEAARALELQLVGDLYVTAETSPRLTTVQGQALKAATAALLAEDAPEPDPVAEPGAQLAHEPEAEEQAPAREGASEAAPVVEGV